MSSSDNTVGYADPIAWLQTRIGAYDVNADYEPKVQKSVLKGLKLVPKRSGRIKTELIDVDLVRGSPFPKQKSQFCWGALTKKSMLRFLLFPLYFRWWRQHFSVAVWAFFLFLYCLFVVVLGLTALDERVDAEPDAFTMTEILTPLALAFSLAFIHTQIVSGSKGTDFRLDYSPSSSSTNSELNRRRSVMRGLSQPRSTPVRDLRPTSSRDVLDDINEHGVASMLRHCDTASFSQMERDRRDLRSDFRDGDDEVNIRVRQVDAPRPIDDPAREGLRHRRPMPEDSGVEDSGVTRVGCLRSCSHDSGWCFWSGEAVNQIENRSGGSVVEGLNTSQVSPNVLPSTPFSSPMSEYCSHERTRHPPTRLGAEYHSMNMDSSASSDFGPRRFKHCKVHGNRDSTASFTDEEFSPSAFASSTNPPNEKRNHSVSPARRRSASPTRRYSQKRHSKKSVALDAIMLSSNNSDEDSDDEAVVCKSPARGQRRSGGATSWDSDVGVEGETDDGDSDTSHALGVLSMVGSSAFQDDTDVLGGADDSAFETACGTKTNSSTAAASSSQNIKTSPVAGGGASVAGGGKVSCRVWEGNEVKKAHLSVADISLIVMEKAESVHFTSDYLVVAVVFSLAAAVLPLFFHVRATIAKFEFASIERFSVEAVIEFALTMLGNRWRDRFLVITSLILRMSLSFLFLFLLSVAERTFKQRLLHAKYFCHLTSARRARASDLPHFRLNKVQNIKAWLSIRSFLKRRGPTRSIDIIVSVSFLVTCFIILLMCVEILKNPDLFLDQLYNWEMMSWGLVLGFLMLRLITLGSKINKKYRNLSVLLTEQINLYLQMEQKPFKKEQFSLANNVLKLAAELLKELDSPFKISGIAANPLLYNISRVVILSAFSGVLTEMLGFKLKLWKIKMR